MYKVKVKISVAQGAYKPRFDTGLYIPPKKRLSISEMKEDLISFLLEGFKKAHPGLELKLEVREFVKIKDDFVCNRQKDV